MTALDLEYFRQRVDDELTAAEQADDPAIVLIHHEMAERYRQLIQTRLKAIGNEPGPTSLGGAIVEPGTVFG